MAITFKLPVIKFKNWPPTTKLLKKLAPAIVFVSLSLVSLLISIGFGVASIVASGNGGRGTFSFYCMAVSTLVALPLPFLSTAALKFLVDTVIVLGVEEIARKMTKTRGENVELPASDFEQQPTDETHFSSLELLSSNLLTEEKSRVEAVFSSYSIRSIYSDRFNTLSKPAALLSLVSLILFTIALNLFLWMILVTYDHYNQLEIKIWPYIVTEVTIGLICPVLVIIATTCMAIVTEFVTVGQVDLKVILQRLIPCVSLVEGELVKTQQTQKYWVISEHFYMPITKPLGENKDLKRAVDHSCSTWILVVISALTVILAVSYFVNNYVAMAQTLSVSDVMQDYNLCNGYNCFTELSFDYVNCSNSTDWSGQTSIYCSKFIRLGKDNNISTVLGLTLAIYLATVHFFHLVFIVINELMKIYHTKLWGILLCIAGVCIMIGTPVILFHPNFVPVHLDAIQCGQFFLLSIYCFLTGVLLCLGQVKEIVKTPVAKKRPSSPAESSADVHEERQRSGSSTAPRPAPSSSDDEKMSKHTNSGSRTLRHSAGEVSPVTALHDELLSIRTITA